MIYIINLLSLIDSSSIPQNSLSLFSVINDSPEKTYDSSNSIAVKRNLKIPDKTWSKQLCIPIQSYPIDNRVDSDQVISNSKIKRIKQQLKMQREQNYTAKVNNNKNQAYK